METCGHKEIENIDSKYTVDNCNLITQQCKKCGCFMKIKTKLKNATCPLQKW